MPGPAKGAGAQRARLAGDGRAGGAGLSPERSGGGGAWRGPSRPGLRRGSGSVAADSSSPPPYPPPPFAGWPRNCGPSFLFRRFLPLSPGLPCGRPGPAPSLPPSPAERAGRVSPGPLRAGLRARIRRAPAPAALRRERGGARGRDRAAATAPPRAPPKKNAAAAAEPIAVCITSCLLLFLRPPRTPRPLGWKRPSSRTGGSGRAGRGLPSPGAEGRAPAPAARPREGDGEGGLAAERPRGSVMRTWCGRRLEREEGGETGTHCSSGWLPAGKGACCCGLPSPPRRPGDARGSAPHPLPLLRAQTAHRRARGRAGIFPAAFPFLRERRNSC